MAEAAGTLAVAAPAPRVRSYSVWAQARMRFLAHHLAVGGAVAFTLISLAVIFGPLVYTVPIDRIDFAQALAGPSAAHPLGTDHLGEDLLARLLYGGRVSIAVGLTAMLVALVVGSLVGALAGIGSATVDHLLMRITDMFLALPSLPLLLLIIFLFRDTLRGAFGPIVGIFILIVAVIGGLRWMTVARLVRASFISLREREFMVAARAIGVPTSRQVTRHLLPNSLGPVVVAATLEVGAAIITESTLSFLGLGFPPDTPSWGRVLFDGQQYLEIAPHYALFPGLLIFITVLSVNYVGDGLRDAFDPRRVL
jgi:peptide/nickel transport system permease protein